MTQPALWMPESTAEFRAHKPTFEQWQAELASGWTGSDGSTSSLDDIEGVQIGVTGTDHRPDLPANHHDFDYRVLRRLGAHYLIDEYERADLQAAADAKHYAGLLEKVAVLVGWNGWKARARAWGRYQALRWFGRRHTLPRHGEAYRDGPALMRGKAPISEN